MSADRGSREGRGFEPRRPLLRARKNGRSNLEMQAWYLALEGRLLHSVIRYPMVTEAPLNALREPLGRPDQDSRIRLELGWGHKT